MVRFEGLYLDKKQLNIHLNLALSTNRSKEILTPRKYFILGTECGRE